MVGLMAGGFDGTSNVLAGKLYNIPVKGTHAHSYISSFSSLGDLHIETLKHKEIGEELSLKEASLRWRSRLADTLHILQSEASDGELAAFISFAIAFPCGFVALVDTYDVLSNSDTPGPLLQGKILVTQGKGLIVARVGGPLNLVLPALASTMLRHLHNAAAPAQCCGACTMLRPLHNAAAPAREVNKWSGILNFCAVALGLHDLGYRAVGIRIDSGDLAYLSCVARAFFATVAKEYELDWFENLQIIASNDINEDTIISLNEQGHKIDCFGIGTHLVLYFEISAPSRKGVSSRKRMKVKSLSLQERVKRTKTRLYATEDMPSLYWHKGKLQQPLPDLEEIREQVKCSLETLRQDHRRNLNPTPYKTPGGASLRPPYDATPGGHHVRVPMQAPFLYQAALDKKHQLAPATSLMGAPLASSTPDCLLQIQPDGKDRFQGSVPHAHIAEVGADGLCSKPPTPDLGPKPGDLKSQRLCLLVQCLEAITRASSDSAKITASSAKTRSVILVLPTDAPQSL
ncbi:Nicotinate phosphoribosyltransferase [Chionoecetes opilio]|uniref:nicotinate phosphoribosyltransferase n=1 Tax=Chionoecetes opilio TaxID=41210 RepID=A0A8J4XZE6_CHIOP|nr:Nicotinate phosphoribosyltransferase [Chionoecetes opilio]